MRQSKSGQAVCKCVRHVIIIFSISSALPLVSFSQAASPSAATNATSLVPRVIKFNGMLKDSSGLPLNGTIPVVFTLYTQAADVEPVWKETQNVSFENGRYSVFLGAATPQGIPTPLFQSGEPHWLGIRIALDDEPEQPRIFMASVPYALKAQDADSLGGLPASAFLRVNSFPEGVPVTAASDPSTPASLSTRVGNQTTASTQNAAPPAQLYVVNAAKLTGGTLDQKIRMCLAALPTGGTCDAQDLGGTQIIANPITVPSHTTLLLPAGAIWFCEIRNPSASCITLASDSALVGLGHGVNSTHLVLAVGTNVASVLKLGGRGVSSHYRVDGLEVTGNCSAFSHCAGTITNAVVDVSGVYDSSFRNLSIDGFQSTIGLWIHDAGPTSGGNSIDFYSLLVDGCALAGAQPLVISQAFAAGLGDIRFYGGDFGHPGTGHSLITIFGNSQRTQASISDVFFFGTYMEANALDATTPIVFLSDALNVQFNGAKLLRGSRSSTAYGFAVIETRPGASNNVGLDNTVVTGGTGHNLIQVKYSDGKQDAHYTDTRDSFIANYRFISPERNDSGGLAGAMAYTGQDVTVRNNLVVPGTLRTGSSANTDLAGECTIGSSCNITFQHKYTHSPICVASGNGAAAQIQMQVSATGLQILGAPGSLVNYICVARN